jgi:hypothetical protein
VKAFPEEPQEKPGQNSVSTELSSIFLCEYVKEITPVADFKLVFGEPFTRTKKNGQIEAEVEVKTSSAPIKYSRLVPARNPNVSSTNADKFSVVLGLSKDEREKALEELIPIGEKLAKDAGLSPKAGEVEKALKKKLKETEEGSGVFRLGAEQRMAFADADEECGFHRVELPVVGPDNQPLEKAFLDDGAEGLISFTMSASRNIETKALQFPFRLRGVKVSKVVLYEFDDNKPQSNPVDFRDVEAGY